MEWTVTIEFAGGGAGEVEDEQLEVLSDALAPHAVVVTGTPEASTLGRWGATVTEMLDDPVDAARWAHQAIEGAAAAAGLPLWPVARLEVRSTTEVDRELNDPQSHSPDLVGIAEVAAMLDISRQRASQIQTRADFPHPLAHLKAGPVWRRHDIAVWARTWERKAGRPTKIKYRVHLGDDPASGTVTGPAFNSEDAAHDWVNLEHPGAIYWLIPSGPNRVGASQPRRFLAEDTSPKS